MTTRSQTGAWHAGQTVGWAVGGVRRVDDCGDGYDVPTREEVYGQRNMVDNSSESTGIHSSQITVRYAVNCANISE